MATIAEVQANFKTQLDAIEQLDQKLAAERKSIQTQAFMANRPMTAEEIARRKEIAATRGELGDAMETLSLDTASALNEASDVDTLIANLNSINQGLQDDLDKLQKLADTAAKAAAVASGMASIVTNLVSLKNTLTSA